MLPAILLFILATAYRVVLGFAGSGNSWAFDFAPLAALALCGPSLFPRRFAFALPLAALLASDIALNIHYGAALFSGMMLTRYVALALITVLGMWLKGSRRPAAWLACSAAGSRGFYLLTNSASWLSDPAYAKTLAGWVQALTIGIPGYPPTWMFFRNAFVSDMLFTMLIVLCLLPRTAARPAVALESTARS